MPRSRNNITILALIAVGIAGIFAVVGDGILLGQEDVLTALLPLPFFIWWIWKRRIDTGWLLIIWTLAVIAMIGSATGDFRELALVNRCTHAGMATLVTLIFFTELHIRLAAIASWLVYLCAGALLMATGALLEIGEAAVSWDSYSGQSRWHDTILDLSANLVGGLFCLICIFIFLRRSTQTRSDSSSP